VPEGAGAVVPLRGHGERFFFPDWNFIFACIYSTAVTPTRRPQMATKKRASKKKATKKKKAKKKK
jgi:hypothetical protein